MTNLQKPISRSLICQVRVCQEQCGAVSWSSVRCMFVDLLSIGYVPGQGSTVVRGEGVHISGQGKLVSLTKAWTEARGSKNGGASDKEHVWTVTPGWPGRSGCGLTVPPTQALLRPCTHPRTLHLCSPGPGWCPPMCPVPRPQPQKGGSPHVGPSYSSTRDPILPSSERKWPPSYEHGPLAVITGFHTLHLLPKSIYHLNK